MNKVLKIVGVGIGIVTVIALLALAFNWERAVRLYRVVTLFDADVIVENFSNMDTMFETLHIKRDGPVFKFGSNPIPLPAFYTYKGEQRRTEDLIRRTSTTALLVVKDNDITFENYYLGTTENDRRISWAVAKSFLAALFGVAVYEGDIGNIGDPVTKYVPTLQGSGYDGVTIKNVLQMSSGVRFNEDYGDFNSDINRMGRLLALGGSFDEFAKSLENERPPGTYLHYVSIDTHVLGMVLRQATGREIGDYFYDKLWSTIGAESDIYYITDSTGEPMVLGGLNMRTRDFARFGRLYRDNGEWNGQEIVPAQWVKASTTPDAPHLLPGERPNSDVILGYGFQWWLPVNADSEFMALGIYDQIIYVNQKAGVVIVKNSANLDFMRNDFEDTDETVEMFRAIVASLSEKQDMKDQG